MTEIIGLNLEQKIFKPQHSKNELLYDPKIRSYESLGNAIQSIKSSRRVKVGFANGKFRVLHPGHCVFLGLCKTQCDILIVGVNSDYSLRLLKEQSPFDAKERAFALSNLSVVDYVTIFDEETPHLCISHLSPDVVFKGPDYKGEDVVSAGRPVMIIDHPFDVHATDVLEPQQKEYKFFKI